MKTKEAVCKKIVLGVFCLLVLCKTVGAQTSAKATLSASDAGTCATANACLSIAIPSSSGGATFAITANASANTIQFEASADYGVTWVALNVVPSNASTAVTSTTGTGTWQANIAGYTNARMRCSTFVGGTTSVNINLSTASASARAGGNLAVKPASTDSQYFVSATGSDSNDGLSWGSAFLTIAHAESVVTGGGHIQVGCGTFATIPGTITATDGLTIEGGGGLSSTFDNSARCTNLTSSAPGAVITVPSVPWVRFANFNVNCNSTVGSTGFVLGGTNNASWATRIILDNIEVGHCGRNILVQSAWGIEFRHVISHDATTDYGIYLHPPAGGYTTTILVDAHSEIANNASSGFFADGVNTNITLRDSIFQNNGAADINLTGTATTLSIEDNYLESGSIPSSLTIVPNYAPTMVIAGNFLSTAGYNIGPNPGLFQYANTGTQLTNGMADIINAESTDALLDGSTIGTLGSQLVTNSGFASSGANWTAQSGWTFGVGLATGTSVPAFNYFYQIIPCVNGQFIKVVTNIVTVTSGHIQIAIDSTGGTYHASAGIVTDYIKCGAFGAVYVEAGFSGFSGTISSVTAYLLTPSTFVASSGTGTWTMVQHVPVSAATCGTGTTCTATIAATGAGHLLVVLEADYTFGTLGAQIKMSSLTAGACTANWQVPAGAANWSNISGKNVSGAYCLNSTGSITSIVVTNNASIGAGDSCVLDVIEYAWSGSSIVLDGAPATALPAASTSPLGVAQTLTGTSDVVVQWIGGNNVTAITGAYINPADFVIANGNAFAGSINTTNGTAPTWTQVLAAPAVASMAFSGVALASGDLVSYSGPGGSLTQDSGISAPSVVTLTGTQTLTNKTLTSPTLVTPAIGAATGASLSVTGALTSTVATGTAPIAVTSTTPVANLELSSLSRISTTVTIGSGADIAATSLCSTALCGAGTYRVNVYIDMTTPCGTTGTFIAWLGYTDDSGARTGSSGTTFFDIAGTGSVPSTGTLTTTSTSNWGQATYILRTTGAATGGLGSINYGATRTACGTAGPMVGKMYLTVEQIQ